MKKIKLPLGGAFAFDEKNYLENNDNDKINLKRFVKLFINQTFKEMKESLGKYHSLSENTSRKERAAFFRQKAADFECLYLFLNGARALNKIEKFDQRSKEIDEGNNLYVQEADEIAHIFFNMKLSVVPKCDILSAIQTIYNPSLFLPSLKEDETKDEISFEEVNRLNRLYLEGENLSAFHTIEVDKGMVKLTTNFFSFQLALCMEINNPEWRLISVDSGSFAFDMHLLYSIPHNISVISDFAKFYKSFYLAREMFSNLKKYKENVEMSIKGFYKKFEVSVFMFKMGVFVNKSGITAKIFTTENTYTAKENAIEKLEEIITESMLKDRSNVKFTFKNGFFTDFNGETIKFRKHTDLYHFLDKKKEEKIFYEFFSNFSVNFKDFQNPNFGDKNILIVKEKYFVCVSLLKIEKEMMGIRLYVGKFELIDFFVFNEINLNIDENSNLYISNKKVADRTHTYEVEKIHDFFTENIGFLFVLSEIIYFFKKEFAIANSCLIIYSNIVDMPNIKIEINSNEMYEVTAGESKFITAEIRILHNYLAFVIQIFNILTISKSEELYRIISLNYYDKISLSFFDLSFNLSFGENFIIETESIALKSAINEAFIKPHGMLDFISCFGLLFSYNLVPTLSTPSTVIFSFRKIFSGNVKLTLIDHNRFYFDNKSEVNNIFKNIIKEGSYYIANTDVEFVQAFSILWCKEKIENFVSELKKRHNIIFKNNEVHVITSLFKIKIWVKGFKIITDIEIVQIHPIHNEDVEKLKNKLNGALTKTKNIKTFLNFIDDIEKKYKISN